MVKTTRQPRSTRRQILAAAGSLAVTPFAPQVLRAQEKSLRIIVPFPPGGAADYVARVVAKELSELSASPGSPAIKAFVENKPGANGVIGVDAVAKSPPDGSTILFTTIGALVINPHLQKVPYAFDDLAPICHAVNNTLTLAVKKDLPVKSLAEYIVLAKEKPGKIAACSSGSGSILHVAIELLRLKAGIDITHVPYKGEGPAVGDLAGGHVDSGVLSLISVQPQMQSGFVRVIAVTGAKRAHALPDVPTIAEQGFPGYEAEAWNSFLAPAKTSPEFISRLNADIVAILKRPAIIENLRQRGSEVVASSVAEFERYIKSEYDKYASVVRDAKIKLE